MVLGSLIGVHHAAPMLLLFAVQSSLLGFNWFIDNFYLANGIVLSSLLLMAVLILLGLAMSALGALAHRGGRAHPGVFVAGKGFGAVINNVMRTDQRLLSRPAAPDLHHRRQSLPSRRRRRARLAAGRLARAVLIFCGLLLLLINRKLRVCEVAG